MGCLHTTIPVERVGRLHVQSQKRSKRKQVRKRNSRGSEQWNVYGSRVNRHVHHKTSYSRDGQKNVTVRKENLKTGERWKGWSVERAGKKLNEGWWMRLQEKEKSTTHATTTTKSKTQKQSVSWLAQGRKRILRNPLRGRIRESDNADSGTPGNRRERKAARNKADLENRHSQIARSVQEKVKESYSFLPDEPRPSKQNALLILTTMQKWFNFCRPTNLAFHDITIGKVDPKSLQLLLGLGVKLCPPLSAPRSTSTRAWINSIETFIFGLYLQASRI